MTERVPQWVGRVTVASVSVVAAVAAVSSYAHVHTLAWRAGEGWRAWLTPLSVDGLLVAASMVMFVRRRASLAAGWLPWFGLVLGLVASLGANVAAGHPEWDSVWLDGVIAAWPAPALAVSFELLILVVRDRRTVTAPAGHPRASALPPAGEESPADTTPPGEPGEQAGGDRVTELIAAGKGRRVIARELQISEHQAKELLKVHRNGSGT